jgi:hypothetical protein
MRHVSSEKWKKFPGLSKNEKTKGIRVYPARKAREHPGSVIAGCCWHLLTQGDSSGLARCLMIRQPSGIRVSQQKVKKHYRGRVNLTNGKNRPIERYWTVIPWILEGRSMRFSVLSAVLDRSIHCALNSPIKFRRMTGRSSIEWVDCAIRIPVLNLLVGPREIPNPIKGMLKMIF